ncbi:hypothetical protein WJX74_010057 [Apatococcus lobatus]|uniref:2-C-methyl-D-erythritol 4-phosphate cytidylyltransferase, chloroplastic n=1 Tax=Apatococcus lobatus TaxID=904363 RepID=A0AAW1QJ06_9CHLO
MILRLSQIHCNSSKVPPHKPQSRPCCGCGRPLQQQLSVLKQGSQQLHGRITAASESRRRNHLQIRAETASNTNGSCLQPESVSVMIVAGGVGKRMGAAIPKQYLDLEGQPIAMYSLQVFAAMPQVGEIIIVCAEPYRELFRKYYDELPQKPALKFAEPGVERQDSVRNGFEAIMPNASVIAIHDSARPLISPNDAVRCMQEGFEQGAAVLGVRVKPTIKEVHSDLTVVKTLKRVNLWEVQTPQVIQPELLRQGFEAMDREHFEVTDDVSIVEALGLPVKLTPGSETNIKVTTPDDMTHALGILEERRAAAEKLAVAEASAVVAA